MYFLLYDKDEGRECRQKFCTDGLECGGVHVGPVHAADCKRAEDTESTRTDSEILAHWDKH